MTTNTCTSLLVGIWSTPAQANSTKCKRLMWSTAFLLQCKGLCCMWSGIHDLESNNYFKISLCNNNCLIFLFSSLSYTNFTYGHNDLQKPFKQSIMVKYLITSISSSSWSRCYFKAHLVCLVCQPFKILLFSQVVNDIRELNLTVVIKVPIKLGAKDIWADSSSLQVTWELIVTEPMKMFWM